MRDNNIYDVEGPEVKTVPPSDLSFKLSLYGVVTSDLFDFLSDSFPSRLLPKHIISLS